jgi:hypothetical protein
MPDTFAVSTRAWYLAHADYEYYLTDRLAKCFRNFFWSFQTNFGQCSFNSITDSNLLTIFVRL